MAVSNSSASFVIGSTLPSTQAVFYDRLAVRALFAHLGFQGLTAERQIPKNAGRTTQIYTYNLAPFTANVSAAALDIGGSPVDVAPPTAVEGTVGKLAKFCLQYKIKSCYIGETLIYYIW
jgi:hypothetical protein